MSAAFFWRLPVQGDGRSFDQDQGHRGDYNRLATHRHDFARTGVRRLGYTYYDYLSQVARAAELSGFTGLSIPQSPAGEEPLIVAGALAREVRRLTLLPSLPAPFLSAVYAAKIAVSFQRLTGGRLAWNLVTEEPRANAWHGHSWSVQEQIARTGEFLDVAKGFWHDKPFTYHGSYYEVENGGFSEALSGQNFPTVHLSGDSPEARQLSARHADVHILSLDTPDILRTKIAELDALAIEHGRTLRYALQADIVARHSDDDAWQYVRRLWARASDKAVSLTDGAQAVTADEASSLKRGQNLWAGFDFLRAAGASAGLVGGYEALADRFAEYAALGIDTFILSASPHLEEAYRIGEQLLPKIHARLGEAAGKAA